MDPNFSGVVQARSLECQVHNGPGPHYDVLGHIEKDGVVQLTGRTADGVWSQIQRDGIAGWALST